MKQNLTVLAFYALRYSLYLPAEAQANRRRKFHG